MFGPLEAVPLFAAAKDAAGEAVGEEVFSCFVFVFFAVLRGLCWDYVIMFFFNRLALLSFAKRIYRK